MTIWERVKSALSSLTVPVSASKLIVKTSDDLPDVFIDFVLVDAPPEQHADNVEISRNYHVQVSVFSRAGLINLPDVTSLMVAAGFSRGAVTQLPPDQDTGHFGLALEFNYLECE